MADKKSIVDQDLIRELAELLKETGLTEIEIERDDSRIRVARGGAPAAPVMAPVTITAPVSVAAPVTDATHPGSVLSPMVGTAYLAADPGSKPFIDIGSQVRQGETLIIIEAMKTMNQIPAPRSGKVTKIMVEDGQPVEFGEPLLIIE
jgi:acetyl-CoA carboxylase biotin carboxyl carrier protein